MDGASDAAQGPPALAQMSDTRSETAAGEAAALVLAAVWISASAGAD